MTGHDIIRSKRRTVSISVDQNAQITVKAPLNMPDQKIQEFVLKNQDWIESHLNSVREQINRKKNFLLSDGLLFLGEVYPVTTGNTYEFNGAYFISATLNFNDAKAGLTEIYQEAAKKHLVKRVSELADKHGFKYNNLRIGSAKTLWGSCSSKKNINLCWRLIMLPSELIDYVIIHELCHLRQMDHSVKFRKELASIIPNFRELEKKLRCFEKNIMINIFI